jgi:uncharacterized repeat protein (TIGR03803 family)
VFKVTKAGTERVVYSLKGGSDGAGPSAGLINVGGTLYGTTTHGGSTSIACERQGCGTVFKVTKGGAETVVYAFTGFSDGGGPYAGLIEVGGMLYDTIAYGGASNCDDGVGCGTVFKVAP